MIATLVSRYNLIDLRSVEGWRSQGFATFNVDPASPRLEALHIPTWGRFGNSVVQVANALMFCRTHGIKSLYFEESHPFILKEHDLGFVRIKTKPITSIAEPVLSHACFLHTTLGISDDQRPDVSALRNFSCQHSKSTIPSAEKSQSVSAPATYSDSGGCPGITASLPFHFISLCCGTHAPNA